MAQANTMYNLSSLQKQLTRNNSSYNPNDKMWKTKSLQFLIKRKKPLKQAYSQFPASNPSQSQVKKPIQFQIFEQMYDKKFVNANMVTISQRNKTFANKGKPISEKQIDIGVPKSKSVGSLLPKLKQLQLISHSDKKKQVDKVKQQIEKLNKNQKAITELGIYINKKLIQKEEQQKLIFVTEQQKNTEEAERLLKQQFSDFIFRRKPTNANNLRAIFQNSDTGLSEAQRHLKIEKQRSQLEKIAKELVLEHQKSDEKNLIEQQEQENGEEPSEIDSSYFEDPNESIQTKSPKNMNWILKECKHYEKKFKVRSKVVKKSKKKPKKNKQNQEA